MFAFVGGSVLPAGSAVASPFAVAPGRTAPKCSLGVGPRVAGVAAAALLLAAPAAHAQMDRDILVFDHDQGLAGADFRNRKDLVGAIFSKSNCKGANFSGADLHNSQLDDTVLIEAVLDGADCENVLATKAKFQKASLRDVNFTNANLISAVFGATDIEGAGKLDRFQVFDIFLLLPCRHCIERTVLTSTFLLSYRLRFCVGTDFTDALIEPAVQKKLCLKASGTNSKTGVDTRESLMCID